MLAILIGLIPAAVIRWVILRRGLSFGPALAITFIIGLGLLGLWQALGQKNPATIGAAAVISFSILFGQAPKKSKAEPLHAVQPSSQTTIVPEEIAASEQIQRGQETAPPARTMNPTPVSEEALYEQAMREAESGQVRAGVWAKAFAEAAGETNKQKALYIQYRVEQEKGLLADAEKAARLEAEAALKRPKEAFVKVLTQLEQKKFRSKKTSRGWQLREPLGGEVKLATDREFLEYAKSRTEVPEFLCSACAQNDIILSFTNGTVITIAEAAK